MIHIFAASVKSLLCMSKVIELRNRNEFGFSRCLLFTASDQKGSSAEHCIKSDSP